MGGPDLWTRTYDANSPTLFKEPAWSSDLYDTTVDGLKIIGGSNNGKLQYPNTYLEKHQYRRWYSQFSGKTCTLACWVKSSSPLTMISIVDSNGTTSTAHSGSGLYEWLVCTRVVASDITSLYLELDSGISVTAFWQKPIFSPVSVIAPDMWVPKAKDMILVEGGIPITSRAEFAPIARGSAVYSYSGVPFTIQSLTQGKIPNEISSIFIKTVSLTSLTIGNFINVGGTGFGLGLYVDGTIYPGATQFVFSGMEVLYVSGGKANTCTAIGFEY